MSRDDKYLNLDEARKANKIGAFEREHPSKGNETIFDRLLRAMAKGKPSKPRAKNDRED